MKYIIFIASLFITNYTSAATDIAEEVTFIVTHEVSANLVDQKSTFLLRHQGGEVHVNLSQLQGDVSLSKLEVLHNEKIIPIPISIWKSMNIRRASSVFVTHVPVSLSNENWGFSVHIEYTAVPNCYKNCGPYDSVQLEFDLRGLKAVSNSSSLGTFKNIYERNL